MKADNNRCHPVTRPHPREGCRIEAERKGTGHSPRSDDQEIDKILRSIEHIRQKLHSLDDATDYEKHQALHEELDRLIARWADLNARRRKRGR